MPTLKLGIDARAAMTGAATFTAATHTVKSAATSTMSVVTRLAAALGASLTAGYILKNALDQEKAYRNLSSALRLVGADTKNNLDILTRFSSEMQRNTIYGDDQIMAQMTALKNMGVHTTRLKEVTQAAIGLAAKYNMELAPAVELVGRAYQGHTQMLARHGIALDTSKSKQEQFNQIIKVGVEAYALATDETKTASGALMQLRNAVGDTAEAIGMAFLPMIKEAAAAITDWLLNNQDRIAMWSEKFVAGINWVTDNIKLFIGYFSSDFGGGIKYGLDASLVLFKAWGQSLMEVLEKIFADIAVNMTRWIEKGLAIKSDRFQIADEMKRLAQNELASQGRVIMGPAEAAAYRKELDTLTEKKIQDYLDSQQSRYESRYPSASSGSWDAVGKKMEDHFATALGKIKQFTPSDLSAELTRAYGAFRSEIDAIEKKYPLSQGQTAPAVGAHANMPALTGGMYERAGGYADPDIIKRMNDTTRAVRDQQYAMTLTDRQAAIWTETIKYQRVAYEELGYSIDQATQASKGLELELENLERMKTLKSIADGVGSAFTNAFTDIIWGAKSASEALSSFTKEIANLVLQYTVMVPIAQGISASIMGSFSGFTGSGTLNSAMGNVFYHGGLIPFASGGIVTRPTIFPMANGAGLMGEAGPEAIMPLKRDSSGRLGVASLGGGVNVQNNIQVVNNSSQPVNAKISDTKFDGKKFVTTVILEDFNSNGPISRGMRQK